MLDRLPLSLQHHVLLEWVSPAVVCAVARAGSSSLRRAVRTAPSAFRAAEGEVIKDGCVRWFHERTALPLVLWTTVTDNWKGVVHTCNGKRHRDGDEPAAILSFGTQLWYQNGKIHRDGDAPAEIWADGTQWWYQHGKIHRDGDLPAVVWSNGRMMWYQRGIIYRDDDKPAIVEFDGSQKWYQNGQLHRDDDLLPAVVEADGTQKWYQNGELHRDNGPAVVNANGVRLWYQHDLLLLGRSGLMRTN